MLCPNINSPLAGCQSMNERRGAPVPYMGLVLMNTGRESPRTTWRRRWRCSRMRARQNVQCRPQSLPRRRSSALFGGAGASGAPPRPWMDRRRCSFHGTTPRLRPHVGGVGWAVRTPTALAITEAAAVAALRRTPSFDDEVRRRVKAGVLAGRISEGIFSSSFFTWTEAGRISGFIT
jgi:hypothetical protein